MLFLNDHVNNCLGFFLRKMVRNVDMVEIHGDSFFQIHYNRYIPYKTTINLFFQHPYRSLKYLRWIKKNKIHLFFCNAR